LEVGPLQLPGDAACPNCAHVLWYSVRPQANITIADVITGKVPTNQDIVRVSQSLISRASPPYVILNLSGVQLVSSSFIAGLIALNKRINDAKGKLVVCELTPVVRETLTGAKLDRILTLVDTESDALAIFTPLDTRLEQATAPDAGQAPFDK
jgi:anti-anti-sigma factor